MKKSTDTQIQQWAAERNLFLNDRILRCDKSGGEVNRWVETILNLTYMRLAREFPEDYKRIDGTPI